MPPHRTSLRVRYGETDRMGVVHHGAYVLYLEEGRTEMMRALGRPYRALEEQGLSLMVTEVDLRFQAPATYDDELWIETEVAEIGKATVTFTYRVLRADPDGQRLLMSQVIGPTEEAATSTQLSFVLNWFEELKRLVPVDN